MNKRININKHINTAEWVNKSMFWGLPSFPGDFCLFTVSFSPYSVQLFNAGFHLYPFPHRAFLIGCSKGSRDPLLLKLRFLPLYNLILLFF